MASTCTAAGLDLTRDSPIAEATEFRQLRHQTKNALQRVLMRVSDSARFDESREGQRIFLDVARQIRLSVAISDALFGMTRSLPPLSERLRLLGEAVIELHTEEEQTIHLDILAPAGRLVSRRRQDAILRIAHELVANAAKHGMYMRLLGHVSVRLADEASGSVILSVTNDGWRMETAAAHGEGLDIVEELVRAEGGDMVIRTFPETDFEIRLPPE